MTSEIPTDDTPQPPDQPEDEGIPDHADDTSTAYRRADRPDFDDSPPALPSDRPIGIDEHGVTAAEQRQGEPLETHLAREEPDVLPDEPAPAVGPDEVAGDEPGSEYGTGYDTLDPGAPLNREGASAEEAAMRELTEDREIAEPDGIPEDDFQQP
jgi:hypothetical protein